MYEDALLIVFIAFCTALLGEGVLYGEFICLTRFSPPPGLTYFFVYRSDEYKRLKLEIERKTKKIEKRREGGGEHDRVANRKLQREEERLKITNRDMSLFKMKSMFAIGFAFTALLSTFNNM